MVKQEKLLSTLISVGGFITTILIWTEYGTDPVNLPKVLVASGFGFAILCVTVYFADKQIWRHSRYSIVASSLFIVVGASTLVTSKAPFAQKFYGVFGRETGFFTYLVLSFFLLASTLIRDIKSIKTILNGLLLGGVTNLVYCGWVTFFGDFVAWNNIYKNILGTLGNPDFVSSYLGMFNALLFAYIAISRIDLKWKAVMSLMAGFSIWLIFESHAIQGLVITVTSFGVVFFYYLRSKFASNILSIAYTFFGFVMSGLAVAGSLSHGPFKFIYKPSVSLRGTYWEVASRIGNSRPMTGVGFDTYGDWYRVFRPERALVGTPPITVHSNVAHNVFLDMFASGGWPLLLTYIGVIVVGLVSILRMTFRQKALNFTFVAIIACWVAYVAQSIISINQVGLAIWGWILTGLLVACDEISKHELQSGSKPLISMNSQLSRDSKLKKKEKLLSPSLVASLGFFLGIFIAFPPVAADGQWRRAVESKNLEQVIASLKTSYMNPASSIKYSQAIQMFSNSNLPEEQYKYAKIAINFNKDSFEAWQALYGSALATSEEKKKSLANMHRLDPLNPNVTGE